MTESNPLDISVSQRELNGLHDRLESVRWSPELESPLYSRNFAPDYRQRVLEYWRTDFDWRSHEQRINQFQNYKTNFDGQRLHFIHSTSPSTDAVPILLLHGWPSSFVEFLDLLPNLTRPGDKNATGPAFDVVVPSLPGYGLSVPLEGSENGVIQIADWFHELMSDELGYEQYAVHGGDWGALIASRLGYAYPESTIGLHLSMIGVAPHPESRDSLSQDEQNWLERMGAWRESEAGYQSIQRTNPYPLGVSLNNSPAGLCAWILDKFCAWSEVKPDRDARISLDDVLTNVMIYWITQSITSSMWLYRLQETDKWQLDPGDSIPVTMGATLYPADIPYPPREWAERVYDVTYWEEADRGGHFPALEETNHLAESLRSFFSELAPTQSEHDR